MTAGLQHPVRSQDRRPRALDRRAFLARAGAVVAALAAGVRPSAAHGGTATAYDDDTPSEAVRKVLRELFGDQPIRKGHVQLDMPEDAPDGRVVPVFIESDLPMLPDDHVRALHLLVDKNPDIHLATFGFTPAVGVASVDTRIKMRASSWVRAIAETSRGELWVATRKVFPRSNGCG